MGRSESDGCRVWRLMVRFFFAQREHLPAAGAEFELSPAQCHVLHLIDPDQPVPMGRLADTLACDASNVTGLIDRLESRGLVERRPSDRDRRVKVLQLTAAGARLRTQMLRRVTAAPFPLARLSPQQQRTLLKILETLVEESAVPDLKS